MAWVKASEVGDFYDIGLSWVLPVPAKHKGMEGMIVHAERTSLIFTSESTDYVVHDLDEIEVQDERKWLKQITLIFDHEVNHDIKVIDQKTGKEVDFDIVEEEKVSAD
jgi:hypothetical protein